MKKRQRVRAALLITALLLFPITMYYFSPYLIVQGAIEGVVSGSMVVFALQFISGIFFQRVFCSYMCPMGGLQEMLFHVNDKTPKQGKRNNIKYIIWVVWFGAILICYALSQNGIHINPFYYTDHGISIANIYSYIIYYVVILIFMVIPILCGKRATCHYVCWMAPFMILGSKFGRALHIPQLKIKAKQEECINCHKCEKVCPMSVSICEEIKQGKVTSSECIQCGLCVDHCPKNVLKYSMKK